MEATPAIRELAVVAAVLSALTVALASAIAFGLGYGSVAIKRALFVAGLAFVGIASLQLRAEVRRDRGGAARGPHRVSGFGRVSEAVLPASWVVPSEERFSDAAVLLATGGCLLLASYLMESVLGVGV